ncbi:DNA-3-methyladenine glycosylase [Nesterenkonia sphaerica]|uniref:Putative 3-methyladenine DNA glycosylase n=1 Tax=Nesterenkonia sphaerica TaxID=1804988 RepID=A0A5R9A645_9MICC|nr:DNA-3-methyladenine glycosylase [Nesterenkonia sphaerica]TLP74179.1 DNA-3-methyladenine glycosylase [Nesterenkonia sphaerica]
MPKYREPASREPSSRQLSALFDQHPVELAPHLLGCALTVTTQEGSVTVKLTEVEAYGDQGEDPGSHAFRGLTARNATLFGPPRQAYVYRSYGIHRCLNLVAGAAQAGGVLLRAGEVLRGRELAVARRGGKDTGAKLLSGPGRLGEGLGITLQMDGTPVRLTDAHPSPASGPAGVRMELTPAAAPPAVLSGPRVGVSGAGGSTEFPWRFWVESDPTVSQYRPGKRLASPQ